jgi:cell wall-associated NlpC family hydrolase
MTHAEQYSTSEPSASPAHRKLPRKRVFTVLALVASIGVTSAVISTARPAAADQLSSDKAEAAAVTAKLQGIQAQEASLTGQVQSAQYHLSQLQSQIAANQSEVAKDQAEVTKDQGQLRTQALNDYTSSGTTNTVTQMFSSNPNTTGIRSEYSSIATGNVTTTIDKLHTAQAALQATQAALQQQQSSANATLSSLNSSKSQAAALASQYNGTLHSLNSQIAADVAAQQAAAAAAAKAAATAAFNAKVAAAQKAQAAAPSRTVSQTTGGKSGGSAATSVAANPPPVSQGVTGAIQAAESQLGVPYVWGGESPGVGFDCSGLVQWSFAQAGISLPRTSGAQYAATTHIPVADIQAGDLLFYGAGGSEHVALYIGGGTMIEAPFTGAVVWETGVRTTGGFAGVGRVG